MISHDRAFLRKLTRRLLWLDRGRHVRARRRLRRFRDSGPQEIIDQEAAEFRRLEKRLETRGILAAARRHRAALAQRWAGVGGLFALRQEKADQPEDARPRQAGAGGGRARRQAGDRGDRHRQELHAAGRPAGSRSSTASPPGSCAATASASSAPTAPARRRCIKMLTGEIAPDSGEVRLGVGIQPIYLDQRRHSFDLERTLVETLAPTGGDSIIVNGRPRHVVGYLRDFLFDERQATMPVAPAVRRRARAADAGQAVRRAGNLIVLDEPTNDLDMDTLDLLQEVLSRIRRHAAAGQPRPRLPRPAGHQHHRGRRRRRRGGICRRLQRLRDPARRARGEGAKPAQGRGQAR